VAQSGYTVPSMLVHAGKNRTEHKLKTDTYKNQRQPRKSKTTQNTAEQN